MTKSWFSRKLTIDRSKWRAGGYGNFMAGGGVIALDNEFGYMCCLGQIIMQEKFDRKDILNQAYPADVLLEECYLGSPGYNSEFTNKAADINDNYDCSHSGRELALWMLGRQHGIYFQFVGEYNAH